MYIVDVLHVDKDLDMCHNDGGFAKNPNLKQPILIYKYNKWDENMSLWVYFTRSNCKFASYHNTWRPFRYEDTIFPL